MPGRAVRHRPWAVMLQVTRERLLQQRCGASPVMEQIRLPAAEVCRQGTLCELLSLFSRHKPAKLRLIHDSWVGS